MGICHFHTVFRETIPDPADQLVPDVPVILGLCPYADKILDIAFLIAVDGGKGCRILQHLFQTTEYMLHLDAGHIIQGRNRLCLDLGLAVPLDIFYFIDFFLIIT